LTHLLMQVTIAVASSALAPVMIQGETWTEVVA
jgi:hypothetical protein